MFTSKGYFMSPSTSPGLSTKVTRLNFFWRDVEISVQRYSETPAGERSQSIKRRMEKTNLLSKSLSAQSKLYLE